MEKAYITIFSDIFDPSLWVMNPVLRQLKVLYGENIEFCYVMANIFHEDSFQKNNNLLNQRIKKYYGKVSMPLSYSSFPFNNDYQNSQSVNLVYKALQDIDETKADIFLYLFQEEVFNEKYDAKTAIDEVIKILNFDQNHFNELISNEQIAAALNEDIKYHDELKVKTYPSIIVSYKENNLPFVGIPSSEQFVNALSQVSNRILLPNKPIVSISLINSFLNKYPLISIDELKEAFAFPSKTKLKAFLEQDDFLKQYRLIKLGYGEFVIKSI